MSSRVLVRAPSNIALVKYMGKREDAGARNLPENTSVSMTLSELCTFVEIRETDRGGIHWIAEAPTGVKGEVPRIDEKGIEKFIAHAFRVLDRTLELSSEPNLEIRTANTFPHGAGIASSASSFAALTLAMVTYAAKDREAFRKAYRTDSSLRATIASLSREGSGSSCRSFDGPFVSWEGESSRTVPTNLPALSDLVVVVSAGEKKVGSSEAHRRVKTSPEWEGRPTRANARHGDMLRAIAAGDFPVLKQIAADDSEDMHHLFETADPAFSYFAPGTKRVLEFAATLGAVTMDAGPNVHLIVPSSEEESARRALAEKFPEYEVLVDRQGTGAEILEIGAATVTKSSRVNWNSYSTTVPGKWVLSGEHTVLRGGRAIALPHPEFSLKLDFRPSERDLEVTPEFGTTSVRELLRIAADWLWRRGVEFEMPRGSLRIQTTIPFGAGLGSSAALSVATARWILSSHSLDRALERELAREMEDHFHGKSSGMDVAAVSIGEPILFSMREGAIELGLRHLPKFTFVDSGFRASTIDCIAKVNRFRGTDEKRAADLDRKMIDSTDKILEGLRAYDEAVDRGENLRASDALSSIASGMSSSRDVFAEWGLVPSEVSAEFDRLERDGIRASRLTGAGGGGFLVGLSQIT